jgi:hypothetical protein
MFNIYLSPGQTGESGQVSRKHRQLQHHYSSRKRCSQVAQTFKLLQREHSEAKSRINTVTVYCMAQMI